MMLKKQFKKVLSKEIMINKNGYLLMAIVYKFLNLLAQGWFKD